jgi:hypothetical protein
VTVINTAAELFIKTGPREKWRSGRFDELLLKIGADQSCRATAELINRIRNQEDGVIPTTIRNQIERAGQEMMSTIASKAEEALAGVDYDNWNN